ncbi:MAG: Rieske 2Fe-2S domain-containing protein [Planctomycetia bacterium]
MDKADSPPAAATPPFEARNQDEIVAMLRAEGVTFRFIECVSEGDYAPEDAAWNYMDIPHLTYVHKQVDGCLTLAGDAFAASVFFQKVPFFRLPLSVLIYQTAPNAVTYYTSYWLFLLVIQTTWEAIGEVRTRVTTRYAVGWTNWLVGLGYPLIKWLIKRNYSILMREDLPMRSQRGRLRKLGYDFKMKGQVPSFIDSRKIMQQNVFTPEHNVVAPAAVPCWPVRTVAYDELRAGEPVFLGADDHMGLSILKAGEAVHVYPRLCSHEGAGLDEAVKRCGGGAATKPGACTIQCPWHGRKFRPLLTIPLPAVAATYETDWHVYKATESGLTIGCKRAAGEQFRHEDWCHPARPVAAAGMGGAGAANTGAR